MSVFTRLGKSCGSSLFCTQFLKGPTQRYSSTAAKSVIGKPTKQISPTAWLLLIVPVSTFSLGVWQMRRKTWKEDLLESLKSRTSTDPVKLPNSLSPEVLKELEYKPVHVRGQFLHDKEMYMGPRSLLKQGDASTKSALVSTKGPTQGYLVVTPFKLEDRDETILVNRGWVPAKNKDPKTRQKGQIKGLTDVIGVVRLTENRASFTMKNQEGSNLYFYRDLPQMASSVGASEIFLDATHDFDVLGGPIGGQTRISLRNEHLSYILTWFSLSGATSFMWYKMCVK